MTNEEDDIVRDKASNDERSVEVLVKTRAVLDALAQLGPSNIKTISSYVGESSSSMYRLLANLVALGWVEHAAKRGEYRLGLACLRVGGQIESRLGVQDVARVSFAGTATIWAHGACSCVGVCVRCASKCGARA